MGPILMLSLPDIVSMMLLIQIVRSERILASGPMLVSFYIGQELSFAS